MEPGQEIMITWAKSRSVWKYPLRYREQVVAEMIENFGHSATCYDDFSSVGSEVTCGYLTDSMNDYIRYSEGFCCMCDVVAIWKSKMNRGGINCGDILSSTMQSFHCLKP